MRKQSRLRCESNNWSSPDSLSLVTLLTRACDEDLVFRQTTIGFAADYPFQTVFLLRRPGRNTPAGCATVSKSIACHSALRPHVQSHMDDPTAQVSMARAEQFTSHEGTCRICNDEHHTADAGHWPSPQHRRKLSLIRRTMDTYRVYDCLLCNKSHFSSHNTATVYTITRERRCRASGHFKGYSVCELRRYLS